MTVFTPEELTCLRKASVSTLKELTNISLLAYSLSFRVLYDSLQSGFLLEVYPSNNNQALRVYKRVKLLARTAREISSEIKEIVPVKEGDATLWKEKIPEPRVARKRGSAEVKKALKLKEEGML